MQEISPKTHSFSESPSSAHSLLR